MRSLKKGPFLDRSLIRLANEINVEIQKSLFENKSMEDSAMKT